MVIPRRWGSHSAPTFSPSRSAVPPSTDIWSVEPAGPASFSVRVTVGGQPGSAHVRVLGASGEVVAEGESGTGLALASGSYALAVQITDAMKSRADFVPVSPGCYEAEAHVKGAIIKVQDILFPDSATQTVPLAVQL